jgi:hypothetical protein
MKIKLIFIVLSIVLLNSILQAQLLKSYGLKVGFNNAEQNWSYSSQSGFDDTGIGPLWGFNFGVFVEPFSYQNFSLITEISYIQKGRTLTFNKIIRSADGQSYIDVGKNETKHRFDYLSIPILAKIKINGKVLTPFVTLGPSLEYLISYPSSDTYDNFNKTEIALKFSGGLEFSFGVGPIFLTEIRYCRSLTNAFKNEILTVDNRVLEFLFGIKF